MKKEDPGIKNYKMLKKFADGLGIAAFGVCRTGDEKKNFSLSAGSIEGLDYAVSIAVGLSRRVLDEIVDKPTRLYFHHYRQANSLLDHITTRMAGFIQQKGYDALPIPASQIVDWEKQTAHLSHKRIAQLAGVGWLGRHNLIVHPKYGAMVRLATILTDMPMKPDKELKSGCNDCRKCVTACPASAIKETQVEFDHMACFEKLKYFQKQRYVDQYICGICVKACLPAPSKKVS